ncbi:MAG: hypothetical protein NVV70_16855 [Cellulomonas sp.]|nr:hypothetical protein [Cellulomonas sp.]MCR6649716.1 hypothetical protein [Cellulomonas sp.]
MGTKIKAALLALALALTALVGFTSPATAYGSCANKWESKIWHDSIGNYSAMVVRVQKASGSYVTIYEDQSTCGVGAYWVRPSTSAATCKETVWIDLTVPNSTYVKVMTPGVQYGGSSGSYKVVDDCRKK